MAVASKKNEMKTKSQNEREYCNQTIKSNVGAAKTSHRQDGMPIRARIHRHKHVDVRLAVGFSVYCYCRAADLTLITLNMLTKPLVLEVKVVKYEKKFFKHAFGLCDSRFALLLPCVCKNCFILSHSTAAAAIAHKTCKKHLDSLHIA